MAVRGATTLWRITILAGILGRKSENIRTQCTVVYENNPLQFGETSLLGDTTLTLHGDHDLLSSVGLDQVEVRFADPLSLAQLPPG